jgi:signal transduction histidine kinase/ActR/RegA family two-component response regulator
MMGFMKRDGDLLDCLVPPADREDPRRRLRHRGIGKSLLSISAVVAILFLIYLCLRPLMTRQEALLFAAAIFSPILGALFVRFTGRIELGLFLTNLAGIGIVAFWCAVTGGITSVALPWFLPNLFLLSTFGSKRMLVATTGTLFTVLILLFLATIRGWLPANQIPPVLTPAFAFLSMLSSMAVIVVAAISVAGERAKSRRRLYEAKNAAEAANRAKSTFLASMSHELRTPLNAVILSADLLQEDQDPPLSSRQSHIVDQLQLGGEILLGLVNQVLRLSSMEAGKVTIAIEEVPLTEAFFSPLGVILPLAKRHQITLDFDLEALSGLHVLADPDQLRSVLINLLSNAVKYNRPQGQVSIRAWGQPGGQVRIEIQDTGQGIPDGMQEAVFRPFDRLGAEGTQIEGTGLGLSISHRLIQMMSGTLGFDSVLGEGTTFWIELPAAPAPVAGAPAFGPKALGALESSGPSAKAMGRSLAVLIVEDHPINQQLLCLALERWGHRATVASNGQEALEALRGGQETPIHFDVVIMDLLMPVMGGLEATRRIRQLEASSGRHVPIVALTACALDQDREACLEAGMDHYLTKPLKIQELARFLSSLQPGAS